MAEGYCDKIEENESGDEVMLHIPNNDSSEEDAENEEADLDKKKVSLSTDHVSSLMQSSFQLEEQAPQQVPPALPDDKIDLNMTDGQAFNNSVAQPTKAPVNGIVRTRGQKNQDKRDARLSSFGIMNGRD